jgi:tRNA 2-selenouridine synthase
MILEDESANIGRNFIPKPLFEHLSRADLVLIDVPFEERVQLTMNEYVIESQSMYIEAFGDEQGLLEWFQYISAGINKIKKKLGAENYSRVMTLLGLAYKDQIESGGYAFHKNWIEIILEKYYDPMYLHSIQTTSKKILHRGNASDVLDYFETSRSIFKNGK